MYNLMLSHTKSVQKKYTLFFPVMYTFFPVMYTFLLVMYPPNIKKSTLSKSSKRRLKKYQRGCLVRRTLYGLCFCTRA